MRRRRSTWLGMLPQGTVPRRPPPKPEPLTAKQVAEALCKLRKRLGPYAVRRLREGKAFLYVWRGSSPHNWYIESHGRSGSYLWHSDGWGDRPDLSMFQRVSDSGERIAHSFVHNEGGSPFKSVFALKPEFRK